MQMLPTLRVPRHWTLPKRMKSDGSCDPTRDARALERCNVRPASLPAGTFRKPGSTASMGSCYIKNFQQESLAFGDSHAFLTSSRQFQSASGAGAKRHVKICRISRGVRDDIFAQGPEIA